MSLLAASVFEDPAWVAAIVALVALPIGIAVPFVVARAQTRRKAVGYAARSASLVRDTARGRLTVLFAGREVSNVALVRVVLVNVGDEPVRREDYDGPIRIRFGDRAEVLDAEVVFAEPASLRPALSVRNEGQQDGMAAGRCVEIAPLLLNSRDSITVEAIVDRHDGSTDSITVDGRIAGIAQIERFDDDATNTAGLLAVAASFSALDLLPGARTLSILLRAGQAMSKRWR